MAPMQYPSHYEMPVDPQIMQNLHQSSWGAGDAMAMDGQPKYDHEDVSVTLREQLEAQIRQDEQTYAHQQNR